MPQDDRWLHAAAALPVGFALVREDALLDVDVVAKAGPATRVLMVASGGCTAAVLATVPNVAHLHLADPNPAQLALARLKLHLLSTASPDGRRTLLGHAPLAAEERRRLLAEALAALELPESVLGPLDLIVRLGPDHAGRYERLFAQLRDTLRPSENELSALLVLRDLGEQTRRVAPTTPLGHALDAAYDEVLALPNLVRLFGEQATQNPGEPFARHFARRTRAALATLPAAYNPYLWLMLAGRLPDAAPIPWLTLPAPARLPEIVCTRGMMADVLAGVKSTERYDVVHLSNILDWLTPGEATRTLELAWRALRPGGYVFIRQLNSTLEIRGLGESFRWLDGESEAMHRRDRSFFYRALHLGEKGMTADSFEDAPSPERSRALAEFERQFTYPLGPDRSFRIEHGSDYARFYRAAGAARCFVASEGDCVLGVLAAAIRPLFLPAGDIQVAYIGDLKVAPQARCGTTLVRLARAAETWARRSADAGFGVVMDGTRTVPAEYTGRAGIPAFAVAGHVMVYRFNCAALREGHALEAREEDVRGCFRRLTAGRPACPPGDPALRSSALPVWLMQPDGSACGCLEDTRRAKRLIADDGQEMVSAHLSCFAWQDVCAGADLVRTACALTAVRGFPALFVAVPRRDADALESALPGIDVVRAPATVYAHGLPNLTDDSWHINSSEI